MKRRLHTRRMGIIFRSAGVVKLFTEIRQFEEIEETELNGAEEGEDRMPEEAGDKVEGEGRLAPPDLRLRAGPRNSPTQKGMEQHEATPVPFRDGCTNCMMGEEEVWEPWTIERVVRFIGLRGCRETTLKSDTEPAIVALTNRVAQVSKAKVAIGNEVKGDNPSNGLIENTMLLLRGVISTIKCHTESSTQEELMESSTVLPWLVVEHAGITLSRCQVGRDGRSPIEKTHGKKPSQEFVRFGKNMLAKRISTEPMNRLTPRYKLEIFSA